MTRRARILGLGVLLILVSAVAAGAWSHLAQYRLVKDVVDQQRDFVPTVRVATVQAPAGDLVVSLPGTTSAFARPTSSPAPAATSISAMSISATK